MRIFQEQSKYCDYNKHSISSSDLSLSDKSYPHKCHSRSPRPPRQRSTDWRVSFHSCNIFIICLTCVAHTASRHDSVSYVQFLKKSAQFSSVSATCSTCSTCPQLCQFVSLSGLELQELHEKDCNNSRKDRHCNNSTSTSRTPTILSFLQKLILFGPNSYNL